MTAVLPERPVGGRLIDQFEYGLDAPICLTWELTYAGRCASLTPHAVRAAAAVGCSASASTTSTSCLDFRKDSLRVLNE